MTDPGDQQQRSNDEGEECRDVDPVELLEALAVTGLGPITVRRLLRRFGSWKRARAAGHSELRELGVRPKAILALRERKLRYDPREEMDKARSLGVKIVSFTSKGYPDALRHYDDAPPLLYVKGEILERDALAIAVVGSRRASLYGRTHAERTAYDLAQAGFTVVSGLAQGVDAAAHRGAMKGGGRTIAVLGNGLASVYPPEHLELAEQVERNGALVSELPLGTPPAAANFPPRNRIIAGLGLGVLVVEASRNSGALITARLGGEMGKEVFAIPGDVGRPQTRGVHRLLRDGAKLVETVADILEELGPLAAPVTVQEGEPAIADARALALNQHERLIYDLLDSSPKDIDHITRESGLSPANAASTLMVLELKRLAVQMPGKLYVRAGAFQRTL